MRNLIAFFRRFQIFLVFVVLQIIALSTYVSNSDFARLQTLSTVSNFNSQLMVVRNDLTKYFNLEHTNKKLAWENRWLRQRLKKSNYKLNKGIISIDDTLFKQQYKYIPATVIQSTFERRNNYMTIDAGQQQGIKVGDGVFSSKGVVGKVFLVGANYSLVKTILSKDINIDVMFLKGGAFGLLKWDGKNPRLVQVEGISNDIRVQHWAKIVTRGGSGIFPRGIPVGKVYQRKFMEGKPLWEIQLFTAEDFRTIQQVYVVKNLHLEELEQLEKAIPIDVEENEF
jgi:rod shape-determining protein MreC